MTHPTHRGFTLIELLVVIAIIGLLASIVLASLSTARSKGQDAARASDVKSLETALELYRNDNAGYPTSNGSANGDVPLSDATLQSKLIPKYISSMPALLIADGDHYYAGGATTGVGGRYNLEIKGLQGGTCKTSIDKSQGSGDWGAGVPFCDF